MEDLDPALQSPQKHGIWQRYKALGGAVVRSLRHRFSRGSDWTKHLPVKPAVALTLLAFLAVLVPSLYWVPPFLEAWSIRQRPALNRAHYDNLVQYGYRATPALRWLLSAEHELFREDFRDKIYASVKKSGRKELIPTLAAELPQLMFETEHPNERARGRDRQRRLYRENDEDEYELPTADWILESFPDFDNPIYQDAIAIQYANKAEALLMSLYKRTPTVITSDTLVDVLNDSKQLWRGYLSFFKDRVDDDEDGPSWADVFPSLDESSAIERYNDSEMSAEMYADHFGFDDISDENAGDLDRFVAALEKVDAIHYQKGKPEKVDVQGWLRKALQAGSGQQKRAVSVLSDSTSYDLLNAMKDVPDPTVRSLVFKRMIALEPVKARADLKPFLKSQDTLDARSISLLLACQKLRSGSGVLDEFEAAFKPGPPRLVLLNNYWELLRVLPSSLIYEGIAKHGYFEVASDGCKPYPFKVNPHEAKDWNNFLYHYPWHPGADDAAARLAACLWQSRNYLGVLHAISQGMQRTDTDCHTLLKVFLIELLMQPEADDPRYHELCQTVRTQINNRSPLECMQKLEKEHATVDAPLISASDVLRVNREYLLLPRLLFDGAVADARQIAQRLEALPTPVGWSFSPLIWECSGRAKDTGWATSFKYLIRGTADRADPFTVAFRLKELVLASDLLQSRDGDESEDQRFLDPLFCKPAKMSSGVKFTSKEVSGQIKAWCFTHSYFATAMRQLWQRQALSISDEASLVTILAALLYRMEAEEVAINVEVAAWCRWAASLDKEVYESLPETVPAIIQRYAQK